MTDQEIIEKLATEVMGWTKRIPHYDFAQRPHYMNDLNERVCVATSWNPLTSIADAWMVVNKVTDNNMFIVEIETDRYITYVRITDNINHDFWGKADTPQRAICMAALKWIENSPKVSEDPQG